MTRFGKFPNTRLRRLRYNAGVRNLVKEIDLRIDNLILPLFIRHGSNVNKPIASMPGHFQISVDNLAQEVLTISALGIKSIILFGIPAQKDFFGKDAYSDTGTIQTAIAVIKQAVPDMLVITDVCFCEYTDHGHCGVIFQTEQGCIIDNDKTLELLAKQAVSHAKAGADIIAPSGMIDGMVYTIRQALDSSNFQHIPILSYSVKYSSFMYGPFREAAEGSPQFGDRNTHQMHFTNAREAIRECALDVSEGADMLMVKPAHTYLDVIFRVKEAFPELPLGAYHTSGEYAMLKAAAEKNWIDEKNTVLEVLTAIRRAGADFIITYYAKEAARWLSTS